MLIVVGGPGLLLVLLLLVFGVSLYRETNVRAEPKFTVVTKAETTSDRRARSVATNKATTAARIGATFLNDPSDPAWAGADDQSLLFGVSVVGDDGRPLAHAKVSYYQRPTFQLSNDDGDLLRSSTPAEAEADENGESRIIGQKGSEYDVIITADGYAATRMRLRSAGAKKVKLGRPASIVGRVVDEDGNSLPGIEVELIHDGQPNAHFVTDELGDYIFNSVTPTNATLLIRNANYLPATGYATVEAGDRTRRDFTLKRGGRLDVEVVDGGGQPVVGASVVLIQLNDGSGVGRVLTSYQGIATFESLQEDASYAVAVRSRTSGAARQVVLCEPRMMGSRTYRREKVVLAPVWSYSAVVRTEDGHPVPGARIILESRNLSAHDSSRDFITIETDEQGRFTVTGLLSQMTYDAFIYHEQFAVNSVIQIQESSPGAIVGPSPSAPLAGNSPTNSNSNSNSSTTTPNPSSTPEPINPEKLPEVTVPVARKGEVTGSVVDESGNPVSNALVFVTLLGAPQGSPGSILIGRTDATGQYSFANLPPGEVSLQAITLANGTTAGSVTLNIAEDGRHTEIIHVQR